MLIGLSGKIGTGKSSLARHMQAHDAQAVWKHCAFADGLKAETARIFDYPLDWAFHEKMKTRVIPVKPEYTVRGRTSKPPQPTMSIREVLQWWGTQVRRTLDPDHWVTILDRAYQRHRSIADYFIVDDVRYKNEADYIRRSGGYLVRVAPYSGWAPGHNADHESETGLDGYTDFHLWITPGRDRLQEAARTIMISHDIMYQRRNP